MSDCKVSLCSSRVCSYGTRSCEANHDLTDGACRHTVINNDAVRLAELHVAGHDADMKSEPECAMCHVTLDSSNEPSAFCSGCVYVVADLTSEALLALREVVVKWRASVQKFPYTPAAHERPLVDAIDSMDDEK